MKQTKGTFSYRLLKSLSQDAVEAKGVNLLKKLIKQVSKSTQTSHQKRFLGHCYSVFDLWLRSSVTNFCMKLEG